jgi:hypothetical protein
MKDEKSLTFLSLSGLTRQSRSSFNTLRLWSAKGGDSRSRIKYGTSFAGMTIIDWSAIFVRIYTRPVNLLRGATRRYAPQDDIPVLFGCAALESGVHGVEF